MNHHRFLRVAVLSFGILVLTASSATANTDSQKSLAERAQAFWDARVAGDWSTEFRFLTRQEPVGATAEKFIEVRKTRGPFDYQSADIGEAVVADDLGWVAVSYTTRMVEFPDVPARSVRIWDIWWKQDGDWYPISEEGRAQVPHLPPHLRSTLDTESLTQRANAYWRAREAQDWSKIYEFLVPTYQETVSKEDFLKRKALYAYFSHSFEWVETISDRGRIKVKYTRKLDDPTLYKLEPEENITIEEWVRVDGQWYRHPRGA